jgi:cobalt-zinc-cadmium efflux system membrane fusion protein
MSRSEASHSVLLLRALIHGLLAIACLQAARCSRAAEQGHGEPAQVGTTREIRLSEEAVRAAGIDSIPVTLEAFHPHVLASGAIRPVVPKSAEVKARVGGRVVRLHVDVGDRVKRGQTLATLEGSEVTAALARHRTANARQIATSEGLERAERLLKMNAISRAVVELRRAEHQSAAAEAEAARQDLVRLGLAPEAAMEQFGDTSEFPVLAPISGTVLKRGLSPGLLVEKEATLFEIADLSTVWAVADVYEKDLGQVEAEGGVEVRTDAYAGVTFPGRIELIEPALDEESRTAHVRVALDNRSGQLRPGMFVTVAIPLKGASESQAPAVPAEAVQKISGIPAVFVQREPGRYELRPVETGREAHGAVEIRHGLVEGEHVVVKGAFVLKSELLKGTIGGEEH